MERNTHLQGICTSHLIYVFLSFPSESLVGEPLPCSLTGSPWEAILCHQSHWSTFHSSVYVCQSPQIGALLHTYGEKQRSRYTEPRADGRPTRSGVRSGSPRGSFMTAISTPVPCSLQHDTFHLGLGRPEPR